MSINFMTIKQTIEESDKEFDWRGIDGAIFDFQVHVRKETGGNDRAAVDSTLIKKIIKEQFKSFLHAQQRKLLLAVDEEILKMAAGELSDEFGMTGYAFREADVFNLAIAQMHSILEENL